MMEQQDVAISQQVPQSHSRRENYLSRTCCLCTCICVCVCVREHECSRITQICQQSSLLSLKQQWSHTNQPSVLMYLLIFLFFLLLTTSLSLTASPFSFLIHPSGLLLAPFLPITSSQPYPPPFSFFSCHPPPLLPVLLLLLLLSRPSWGAQWDASGGVVVWCVCLCDVTLQQLYSSSLSLSLLIPVLADHTAILRFYKPFQRSFEEKACPCAVYSECVCLIRMCVSVMAADSQ